ncbi:glycerophosphodiester phosphodiesterase [Parapedobacter deserti]|uniref:Glycerophosphodiester phosphodiesterase n=1 Tax=Parapedobacter deserti TaxID=1912957 RepID=A0ABV7JHY8_9SPHI
MNVKTHFLCLLLLCAAVPLLQAQHAPYRLIAHRGGVVNDTLEENSLPSLVAAAARDYYMVELDVRMTRDSVLVAHHDRHLKRYFNSDREVGEMTWPELHALVSVRGNRVQRLETLLDTCRRYGMQVMIDWKIRGDDLRPCRALVSMLEARSLRDSALIIPSAAVTDFFRGKIRLSCTRQQIETYQQRADYHPSHYYLFANPTAEDLRWATAQGVMVVGVLNARTNQTTAHYRGVAEHLKSLGVRYVQLDSQFDRLFIK